MDYGWVGDRCKTSPPIPFANFVRAYTLPARFTKAKIVDKVKEKGLQ
jgi:hypothetical protein